MTFNENDVNRDKGGRFDNKTGSPSSVTLSAGDNSDGQLGDRLESFLSPLTDQETRAGMAVAKSFAPNSKLSPVKVFDGQTASAYRIGLMESNGAIYYSYEADEDGIPLNLDICGERQPYNSGQYRAAEEEAWEANGMPIPDEDARRARHIEHDVKSFGQSVLRRTRPMNGNLTAGDWHYETDDIRLGTGSDKERLYGSFRIERVTKDGATRYDVAYTGTVNSSTGRMESMGQTLDQFENAEPYAKGKKASDVDPVRYFELWDKNHLTRDATADDIYESLDMLSRARKFQG